MGEQPKTGIYLITHVATGRPYVGLCGRKEGFEIRWNQHRNALRNNNHTSKHFQRAWNKYGEEAFSFSVHTYIARENKTIDEFYDFLRQEEYRILKLYPDNFNGHEAGEDGMTHRKEVRQKIREANIEKMKDPLYKARKIAEINTPAATQKRIATNKSIRIKQIRSQQLTEQMKDPILRARRLNHLHTKESQAKATNGKQEKWQDPKWASKMKETLRKSWSTPEVAEKKRIATQAQWNDPVMREKRLTANRKAAATRKARRLATPPTPSQSSPSDSET